MQRKTLITFVLFCLAPKYLCSQIWQHTYGYNGSFEIARGVKSDYDNGFLLGLDKNDNSIFLFKPDINGNVLWEKYVRSIAEYGMILSHINNNENGEVFYTGGIYPSNDVYSFVVFMDECGDINWCRTITLNNENYGEFVFPLPNENILLCTYNASLTPGYDRYQLWEIDPDGHIIWMRQVLPGTQTFFLTPSFFKCALPPMGAASWPVIPIILTTPQTMPGTAYYNHAL